LERGVVCLGVDCFSVRNPWMAKHGKNSRLLVLLDVSFLRGDHVQVLNLRRDLLDHLVVVG